MLAGSVGPRASGHPESAPGHRELVGQETTQLRQLVSTRQITEFSWDSEIKLCMEEIGQLRVAQTIIVLRMLRVAC